MHEDFCKYCGTELLEEKYYIPISVDEYLVLCYNCQLEESAAEVLSEITDDYEDYFDDEYDESDYDDWDF